MSGAKIRTGSQTNENDDIAQKNERHAV